MPISRIAFHQQQYDAQQIAQVSEILHQTLVDEFAVPLADRFQILEPKAAGELIYDATYLANGRTERYLLFSILGGKPRTTAQKAAFYRCLTDRLVAALDISPSDVMITLQFNALEEWCFGEGEMAGAKNLHNT